jgi:hypothetical protein
MTISCNCYCICVCICQMSTLDRHGAPCCSAVVIVCITLRCSNLKVMHVVYTSRWFCSCLAWGAMTASSADKPMAMLAVHGKAHVVPEGTCWVLDKLTNCRAGDAGGVFLLPLILSPGVPADACGMHLCYFTFLSVLCTAFACVSSINPLMICWSGQCCHQSL